MEATKASTIGKAVLVPVSFSRLIKRLNQSRDRLIKYTDLRGANIQKTIGGETTMTSKLHSVILI